VTVAEPPTAGAPGCTVIRDDDAAPTLVVSGDVDWASAPLIEHHLAQLMTHPVDEIRVDLASVRFIDSTGLRSLILAGHRLSAAGGRLRVVEASITARRIIELSGLSEVFSLPPAPPKPPPPAPQP
jgi:anti-sigma B factor antagonist